MFYYNKYIGVEFYIKLATVSALLHYLCHKVTEMKSSELKQREKNEHSIIKSKKLLIVIALI